MNTKLTKPITETKYLSADNAWRYRSIMRLFYVHSQRFTHWLSKEDVFEELSREEAFSEYTLELCRQDLDVLVSWGSLSAVQDTAKVSTYQQFMNKQFRYQMTEYAIEIERLTVRLENLFFEHGSLEPTLLERIKNQIGEIHRMAGEDYKSIGGWWSGLASDFQRLNQNYQDYIRDWNSVKAEEMMKSRSFLLQKEKLVDYLRHFIKELQAHSYEIEGLLKKISPDEKVVIFQKITDYEKDIPRIDMELVQDESILENIRGKYESMESFFCPAPGRFSEVERILEITNEIIRKITRYAVVILDAASQYTNRKDEYRRVMELFTSCSSQEERHRMAGQVFGVGRFRHFQGNLERETDSIFSSIWDESPCIVITEPRLRTYREKILKTAIRDDSQGKKAMRERILLEKEEERRVVEQVIRDQKICFNQLGEVAPFVRKILLRWLMKALTTPEASVSTEYGRKYRLANPTETARCTLTSEDGNFEMPAFVLEFDEV